MITVEVTTTNYTISASEQSFPVTVTADNSLFTVTSVAQSFTVTTVSPVITFSTEGAGFDFAEKNVGDWVSNTRYYRNDVVRYQYSIYICKVDPLDYVQSSTPPAQDTTNWELFVFNEWPRAYLTVNNTLTVVSTATFLGDVVVAGGLSSTANLTGARGTFTNSLQVGQGATTGTFKINSITYPWDTGTYGQVLFTNGTDRAAWVNLGELVFWELSEDLKTEGFNIVSGGSGNQLTIGGGVTGGFHNSIRFNDVAAGANIDVVGQTNFANTVTISGALTLNSVLRVDDVAGIQGWTGTAPTLIKVNTGFQFPDGSTQTSAFNLPVASPTQLGGVRIGTGVSMSGELLNLNAATTSTLGGVKVGEYLSVSGDGTLTVNTATLAAVLDTLSYTLPIATTSTLGGVRVGSTLNINTTTGVLNANGATTSTAGVVQVGEFLNVTGTNILSVNTATLADALGLATYTLPIATTSTLGGVQIGDYLTINTGSGVLSINTATLAPALVDIQLPVASDSVLGGVRVANTSSISINTATGNISVPTATTGTLGVVRVGTGLAVSQNGTLSLDSNNNYGNISLSQDMETNGYSIRRGDSYPDVKLLLDTISALLQGGTTGINIRITTSTVEINTLNTITNRVEIKSPTVIMGYDIYNSRVQAGSYYNFEGTGAAFFPANIKFSDDTIQRTAWRGYDQGLI